MSRFSFQFLKRLMTARDGSVAVEFGLASIPLFMLVIGLLEVSLMYASATVLEGGTVMASRLIRTGQAQLSGDPETMFADALCDTVEGLIDCDRLQYEVLQPAGNSFDDADGMPPQFDGSGELVPQGFDAGGVSDVVIVRTAYRYRFITPFIAPLLANNSDNGVTLMSTITLRNEPYDFEN